MHTLRNSYYPLLRWMCLLLVVHLLNISIDAPDLNPEYIEEDLSVNDIESISEFIAEVVLGYKNAFKEYDDVDGNKASILEFSKVFIGDPFEFVCSSFHAVTIKSSYLISEDLCFPHLPQEVASPPPQA